MLSLPVFGHQFLAAKYDTRVSQKQAMDLYDESVMSERVTIAGLESDEQLVDFAEREAIPCNGSALVPICRLKH